jgi:hypothetical protein
MANFGLWSPFINEREMLGWYRLPATMQAELNRYQPDGNELEPLSTGAFASLHRRTVSYVNQSVAGFRPAYHGVTHFRRTEKAGLAAADAYAGRGSRRMPEAVRQALSLALYAHDAHHCASTFRADAPRGVYRGSLGNRVSTEWVTALAVNEFMTAGGLTFPARMFQTGVIWASTYGGNTSRGRSFGIPDVKPRNVWGCIMRAADICPPSSFTIWLAEGIAVQYGEVPAMPAPTTFRAFIENRLGFLGYMSYCMDQLDGAAGSSLTGSLGWRSKVGQFRNELNRLTTGDATLIEFLRRELSKYHVTLE